MSGVSLGGLLMVTKVQGWLGVSLAVHFAACLSQQTFNFVSECESNEGIGGTGLMPGYVNPFNGPAKPNVFLKVQIHVFPGNS